MAYFRIDSGGNSGGTLATITVSYLSAFYNKTITCSDGTTTYTKTTDSSGSIEFTVEDEGTWTVTCNGVSKSLQVVFNYSLNMTTTKTIDIYSAASDTVTFIDTTGAKTCSTDTSGHGTVSITFTPNQQITFTSSYAKNPSNLSQYYSKTVTLNDNVSAVYVMPDNALYWYGYTLQYNIAAYNFPAYAYSVTLNTRDITILTTAYPNGGYYFAGVIFNKAVTNETKLKSIVRSSGTPSAYYNDYFGTCANFSDDNPIQGGYNTLNQNTPITDILISYDLTSVSHIGRYPAYGRNGGTGVISALWFE